jgi:mRNA interferase MazF
LDLVNLIQYDIYWVELNPTFGVEINKVRPCIILSPKEMNDRLLTVIIAPITSTIRTLPFRPNIKIDNRDGQIMLDQLRGIDKRRLRNYICSADANSIEQVKENIVEILVS